MSRLVVRRLIRRLRRQEMKQTKVKWWRTRLARHSWIVRLMYPPLFVILITLLLIVVLFPWVHGKGHG